MSEPGGWDRSAHRRLRAALADLCAEKTTIQMVARDAGLATDRVDFAGGAETAWEAILVEAAKGPALPALVEVARERYPGRAEFADALALLRPRAPASPTTPKPTPGVFSTHRLPGSGALLVGREEELAILDAAWEGPKRKRLVSVIAWGGTGKSALVNHWIAKLMARDHGARDVYGWSFYSQGSTGEGGASADPFFAQALKDFGDPDPTAGDAFAKAERLAEILRNRRTLLILDGVEPLQYPPGPEEGRFKDKAFAVLLRQLVLRSEGLCVVTSRVPLADLAASEEASEEGEKPARRIELQQLSPQAGAELLRRMKVQGPGEELEKASVEFGGHALALTLLGAYLVAACEGKVERRREVGPLEEEDTHGGHANRVMQSYETWLGPGPERDALYLIGLFDRPASAAALAVLRTAPVLRGLNDSLVGQSGKKWQTTLARLRRLHLIEQPSPQAPSDVDAHPLVREHFGLRLRAQHPHAFRAAHDRIFEHFCRSTPNQPETLEGIGRLYAAVHHGCCAGRHQHVLDQVYFLRINRRSEYYSTQKLGALGMDLGALSEFFEEPWSRPLKTLAIPDQAWVLGRAGFLLSGLGRLRDAVGPLQAALDARVRQKTWNNASRVAVNLSGLQLTLGSLKRAVLIARQSVDYASQDQSMQARAGASTTLANALFHENPAEHFEEIQQLFAEAEAIQRQLRPDYPWLYSVPSYQYCEVHLYRGASEEVLSRAERALRDAEREGQLLSIALGHLSLGHAHLQLACHRRSGSPHSEAMSLAGVHFNHAVIALRKAGFQDELPRGLLARANFALHVDDIAGAQSDLAEALEIATRGEMRLHLADTHLGYARLFLAEGDPAKAREHLALASTLVTECGYGRRDPEVAALERELAPA